MLKKIVVAAALIAATPALAGSYVDQYPGYYRQHWHPYPSWLACIPYGMPMIPSVRRWDYVPGAGAPLPVQVYFVPQQNPLYNVPPYEVIAPY